MEARIAVGYVARAHGVRGELRIHLHDLASTALFEVDRVFIGGVEREVRHARDSNGAVLMTVAGVDGRDAAEALRGSAVEVAREDVPLSPGEYYVVDLIGCSAEDEAGAPLGTVAEVIHGAQDLLVLRDERCERILPLVPEFLRSVDVTARRIVVAPPEGLPEEPLPRKR